MQHFDRFIELDKLVKKSLIIYRTEFEVKGAYIHNEIDPRSSCELVEFIKSSKSKEFIATEE